MKHCPLLNKECLGQDCKWWMEVELADGTKIYECGPALGITLSSLRLAESIGSLPHPSDVEA